MPYLSERDELNLQAILESILKIESFVKDISTPEEFNEDDRTFDAVLMNFVVIGECVSRVSEQLRDKESEVPWQQIKSFRNFVSHNYFGVDSEEVWQIIQNHLPTLRIKIELMLKK